MQLNEFDVSPSYDLLEEKQNFILSQFITEKIQIYIYIEKRRNSLDKNTKRKYKKNYEQRVMSLSSTFLISINKARKKKNKY